MSRDDFFATVKYEPPPKPQRPRFATMLIVGAVALSLVAIALGGWLVLKLGQFKPAKLEGIPPAGIKAGKKLPWRELVAYEWVPDEAHPRPSITVADFNSDGRQDILQVDPKATTELIGIDGGAKPLTEAKWKMLTRFTPWDFNRDGVAELVPDAFIYAFVQTPKGYSTIRLKGG